MRLENRFTATALMVSCALASMPAAAITLPAFDLPQIGSIDLPKTAKAGETVQMTIKAAKDGSSACGMIVSFGDGSDQLFKMNVDNAKFPLTVEHVYKNAGKYAIQARGRKVTTHHSCKENAQAVIQITPVKQAKGKAKGKK